MKNGASNFLFNSWEKSKKYDGYTYPLLCKKCDNETFSNWENSFKNKIFDKRFSTSSWDTGIAIKFYLSLSYRYSAFYRIRNQNSKTYTNNLLFEKLSKDALNNPNLVGNTIFIYPTVYNSIIQKNRGLISGVNQLLRLSCHAVSLPKEQGLPNGFLVIFPDFLVLFTDGPLTSDAYCSMTQPNHYTLQSNPYNTLNTNTDLADFLKSILNRLINEAKSNQKSFGFWSNKIVYFKRHLFPNRVIWDAIENDKKL